MALITLGATQVMNLAFIWRLQHAGLALAIGLGACINAGLLLRGLLRREIYSPQPGWPVFLLKLAIAVYAMAAVVWLAAGPDAAWLSMRAASRALQLTAVVLAGVVSYFAALGLLGFRVADFSRKGVE
jgi:putative peptidoglycan lipid II flippase